MSHEKSQGFRYWQEKAEGYDFIWEKHRVSGRKSRPPPPTTALLRPVRPMGGNAAVVREEKVMRLSVVSRHRGALDFLDAPLPTALG